MNFMSFLIKFIKFKQRMKFKKFELHNTGTPSVVVNAAGSTCGMALRLADTSSCRRNATTMLSTSARSKFTLLLVSLVSVAGA